MTNPIIITLAMLEKRLSSTEELAGFCMAFGDTLTMDSVEDGGTKSAPAS